MKKASFLWAWNLILTNAAFCIFMAYTVRPAIVGIIASVVITNWCFYCGIRQKEANENLYKDD